MNHYPTNLISRKERTFPFYKESSLSAVIALNGKKYLKISIGRGRDTDKDYLYCIHTKLYDTNIENIENASKIQIQSEISKTIGKEEISLSKDEDFFALCSWVEGIAENGIQSFIIQKTIENASISTPVSRFLFRFLIAHYPEIEDIYLYYIAQECKLEDEWHEPSLIANIDIVLKTFFDIQGKGSDLSKKDIKDRFDKIFQYNFPTEILLKSDNMRRYIIENNDHKDILLNYFKQDEIDDIIESEINAGDPKDTIMKVNIISEFIHNKKKRLAKILEIIALIVPSALLISYMINAITIIGHIVEIGAIIIDAIFSIWAVISGIYPFIHAIIVVDFDSYNKLCSGNLHNMHEVTASSNGKEILLKVLEMRGYIKERAFSRRINRYYIAFDTYPKHIDIGHNEWLIHANRVTIKDFPLWKRNVFNDSFGDSVIFKLPDGKEIRPYLYFAK